MNLLRSLIIVLASLTFGLSAFSADLSLEVDLETYKVNPSPKPVNLKQIRESVEAEKSSLPIEQLTRDFNSLLSENGDSDREEINFEDDELATAAE